MQTTLRNAFLGLCIGASFLLALSYPLRAQGIAASSGDISGNVGFSSLTGVDGNKHVNFGGSAGINLWRQITILGEYTYMPMGTLTESSTGGNGIPMPDFGSLSYQTIGGAARFNMSGSRIVIPYAIVGFGYARQSASATLLPGAGIGVLGGSSSSYNGEYMNFGGGASIFLGKHYGLRPEFRYERQEFYASGNSAGQNVALGTVSFFYQFGGIGKKRKQAQ
jgi:hypothetical protein